MRFEVESKIARFDGRYEYDYGFLDELMAMVDDMRTGSLAV